MTFIQKGDQLILTRAHALPAERIMGVETGGCPHTAIREDASMNLAAIEDMNRKFPHAELCFVESGGDNLAATFSPELADLTIYVIDIAEGEKIPRKGGPGITRSDLTYRQAADILSQAIGKKVRYDSSRENYAKFLKKIGLDVDEVLELDACVANGIGDGSAVTNTIFE